jgi:DNA helicase HerA-like ATPase
MAESIFVGGGGEGYGVAQALLLKYGNRHGLIAGATGTGKTVTLQILAEGFSSAGVPVFMADVKGDLSGVGVAGSPGQKLHDAFMKRAATIKFDLQYRSFPVTFWDIWGQNGHPIRATVAEMGPLLLARMLQLNDTQEGVLNVAFRLADEEQLPILDLKDLQALLVFVADHADEVSKRYGLVAGTSIGAIQRQLLVLENQGAVAMFGEPALDLADLMRVDATGAGMINVLSAEKLMLNPQLYATFLLWLLSELFETLPEVGDPDRPKLVFFFDEAHLLFTDAPKAEQVARLIRSKGVGVYFISQNPADIPEVILGQLGNRVQHGLRAFTPKDQKDLGHAAETYRPNPRFDTATAIREVGTGEAVTSFLEDKGVPGIVERTLIRPPSTQLGPIDPGQRAAIITASPMGAKYNPTVDRDSAYERLQARAAKSAGAAPPAPPVAPAPGNPDQPPQYNHARQIGGGAVGRASAPRAPSSRSDSLTEAFAKSFVRQIGTRTGQAVVRGILGGIFGK